MMNGDWSNWHWGFGFGHWIFGVLFWSLIILAVIFLARSFGGRPNRSSAFELLRQRYARGEIDKDEYERTRRDLER